MTKIDGLGILFTTESYNSPGLVGSFLEGGAFIPAAPIVNFPTSTLATYI